MRPKNGIRVSYILEKEIAESLDDFCEETGRTKTKVVEMALKEFINKCREKEGYRKDIPKD